MKNLGNDAWPTTSRLAKDCKGIPVGGFHSVQGGDLSLLLGVNVKRKTISKLDCLCLDGAEAVTECFATSDKRARNDIRHVDRLTLLLNQTIRVYDRCRKLIYLIMLVDTDSD
jgi:hypothetical protein